MNLLLGVISNFFSTYFDNLGAMLKSVEILMALFFAIIGVSTAVLARRIARVIRKRNDIDDGDAALVGVKAVGLVFMLVAFLILVLQSFA